MRTVTSGGQVLSLPHPASPKRFQRDDEHNFSTEVVPTPPSCVTRASITRSAAAEAEVPAAASWSCSRGSLGSCRRTPSASATPSSGDPRSGSTTTRRTPSWRWRGSGPRRSGSGNTARWRTPSEKTGLWGWGTDLGLCLRTSFEFIIGNTHFCCV